MIILFFIFDKYVTTNNKIMRSIYLFLLVIIVTLSADAQTNTATTQQDTLAPYQKTPYIPSFSIQMPDSSWFSKTDLRPKGQRLFFISAPTADTARMKQKDC